MMIMSSKGKLPFSTSPSSSSSSLSPSSSALPKEAEDIPSDALALGLATSAAAAAGNGGGGGVPIEKEHMFDKVVTPSDVGKLNRLVIPKQHAEKYFPLDTASASEKGLLLNFEDRSGKHWRFRYSYWNSSQSYVMTKGWSRFVKDKKLDAGDVVSFHRAQDRLFIDCRPRPHDYYGHHHQQHHHQYYFNHSGGHHQSRLLPHYQYRSSSVSAPLFVQNHYHDHQSMAAMRDHASFFQQNSAINHNYSSSYDSSCSGPYGGGGGRMYDPLVMNPPLVYIRSAAVLQPQIRGRISGTSSDDQQVEPIVLFDSMRPAEPGNYNKKAESKRLRLFGVNMEYSAISSSSSTTTMITDAAAMGSDDQPTDRHSLSNSNAC